MNSADKIAAAKEATSDITEVRVESKIDRLRQQLVDGTYPIEPDKIADRLIGQRLVGASTETS